MVSKNCGGAGIDTKRAEMDEFPVTFISNWREKRTSKDAPTATARLPVFCRVKLELLLRENCVVTVTPELPCKVMLRFSEVTSVSWNLSPSLPTVTTLALADACKCAAVFAFISSAKFLA